MTDIAVVVTCHTPYLKWLPAAMASIDRQIPEPAERIVVCDGCTAAWLDDRHWRQISGKWRRPSPGRNAAMEVTTAPWIIFWDADNVMPDGYIAAMQQAINAATSDCAIIYPDLQFVDEDLVPLAFWTTPSYDYWTLRAQNFINTASAWRRAAIECAGGWASRTSGYEDYVLALDITALGWHAVKLVGPPMGLRLHHSSMSETGAQEGSVLSDLWRARSLALVSQLTGYSASLERWEHFVLNADLPPKTALYVVEGRGSPAFAARLHASCRRIIAARDLLHVDIVAAGSRHARASASGTHGEAHQGAWAFLLAGVLPRISEDLVMTIEDGIEIPLDAPRRLGEQIAFAALGNVGAVAAAHPMCDAQDRICAGRSDGDRRFGLRWDELGAETEDVRWVGGGCTVWATWALRGSPLHLGSDRRFSWNQALCLDLHRKGYDVRLDGSVRCSRHANES